MKLYKKDLLLYGVTVRDSNNVTDLFQKIEAALCNGVACIQLREKDCPRDVFLYEANHISRLCRRYNVPFIINDDVGIAVKSDADGVHVGQDDMSVSEVRRLAGKDLIVGVSAHNVEEAIAAEKAGADYLGCGSVFVTSTKNNVTPLSVETLKAICSAVSIPVVAIGGISSENVHLLSGSGIAGVAAASSVFCAADPGAASAELLCRIKSIVGSCSRREVL